MLFEGSQVVLDFPLENGPPSGRGLQSRRTLKTGRDIPLAGTRKAAPMDHPSLSHLYSAMCL